MLILLFVGRVKKYAFFSESSNCSNNEINIFSSIVQFEKYIKDEYEFVTDEYLIPVLSTISKYHSSTFPLVTNLSIVVFEKINEDITISPPLGGFNNLSDSMILLYKESRYSYEPILYRKWDTSVGKFIYTGIIKSVDESNELINSLSSFSKNSDSVKGASIPKHLIISNETPEEGLVYGFYDIKEKEFLGKNIQYIDFVTRGVSNIFIGVLPMIFHPPGLSKV